MSTSDGSMYFAGTKGSSPIKLRSAALTMTPHIMPPPSRIPWNSCEMPWTLADTYSGVMEFKGYPHCSITGKCVVKRKAEVEPDITPKQQITEEKMAEHMSGLHISSEYTSHNTNNLESMSVESEVKPEPSTSYNINMTPYDLEQKLKNANRLTVCEQIKLFHSSDNQIIPQALLARLERPCTALVLWQPPQNLTNLIIPLSNERERKRNDDEQDNNNSSSVDYNSSMDLDI